MFLQQVFSSKDVCSLISMNDVFDLSSKVADNHLAWIRVSSLDILNKLMIISSLS